MATLTKQFVKGEIYEVLLDTNVNRFV